MKIVWSTETTYFNALCSIMLREQNDNDTHSEDRRVCVRPGIKKQLIKCNHCYNNATAQFNKFIPHEIKVRFDQPIVYSPEVISGSYTSSSFRAKTLERPRAYNLNDAGVGPAAIRDGNRIDSFYDNLILSNPYFAGLRGGPCDQTIPFCHKIVDGRFRQYYWTKVDNLSRKAGGCSKVIRLADANIDVKVSNPSYFYNQYSPDTYLYFIDGGGTYEQQDALCCIAKVDCEYEMSEPYSDLNMVTTSNWTRTLGTACNFSEFTLKNVKRTLEMEFPNPNFLNPVRGRPNTEFIPPTTYPFNVALVRGDCLWAAFYGKMDYFVSNRAQYTWITDQFPVGHPKWYPKGYFEGRGDNVSIWEKWSTAPLNQCPQNPSIRWTGSSRNYSANVGGYFYGEPPAPIAINKYATLQCPLDKAAVVAAGFNWTEIFPIPNADWDAEQACVKLGNPNYVIPPAPDYNKMYPFTKTAIVSRIAGPVEYLNTSPNPSRENWTYKIGGLNIINGVQTNSEVMNHPLELWKGGPRFPNGDPTYRTLECTGVNYTIPAKTTIGSVSIDSSNALQSWFVSHGYGSKTSFSIPDGRSFTDFGILIASGDTVNNNLYLNTKLSLPVELTGPIPCRQKQFSWGIGTECGFFLPALTSGVFGAERYRAKGFLSGYYWTLTTELPNGSTGQVGTKIVLMLYQAIPPLNTKVSSNQINVLGGINLLGVDGTNTIRRYDSGFGYNTNILPDRVIARLMSEEAKHDATYLDDNAPFVAPAYHAYGGDAPRTINKPLPLIYNNQGPDGDQGYNSDLMWVGRWQGFMQCNTTGWMTLNLVASGNTTPGDGVWTTFLGQARSQPIRVGIDPRSLPKTCQIYIGDEK